MEIYGWTKCTDTKFEIKPRRNWGASNKLKEEAPPTTTWFFDDFSTLALRQFRMCVKEYSAIWVENSAIGFLRMMSVSRSHCPFPRERWMFPHYRSWLALLPITLCCDKAQLSKVWHNPRTPYHNFVHSPKRRNTLFLGRSRHGHTPNKSGRGLSIYDLTLRYWRAAISTEKGARN